MVVKKSIEEKVFDIVNVTIMILLIIVTLYPFLYVAFASISDPAEIMSHRGLLLYPKGFSLGAYRLVFQNPMISVGYKNTLFSSWNCHKYIYDFAGSLCFIKKECILEQIYNVYNCIYNVF